MGVNNTEEGRKAALDEKFAGTKELPGRPVLLTQRLVRGAVHEGQPHAVAELQLWAVARTFFNEKKVSEKYWVGKPRIKSTRGEAAENFLRVDS